MKKKEPVKRMAPGGLDVHCLRLRDDEIWRLPEKAFDSDAGADLTISRHVTINPNGRAQLPTNMAIAIPDGFYGQVLARSSTFHKRGLVVHSGVIDSGYRGEVMIVVFNPGPRAVFVQEGERLAQIILLPVTRAAYKPERTLAKGERAEKGFGSTGGFSGDLLPAPRED